MSAGWLRNGPLVLAELEGGGVRLLALAQGETPRAGVERMRAQPGVVRVGLAAVYEIQEAAR